MVKVGVSVKVVVGVALLVTTNGVELTVGEAELVPVTVKVVVTVEAAPSGFGLRERAIKPAQ